MKGQSEAKLEKLLLLDMRIIGKTFNKIKVISYAHTENSRRFYNVLCLRCNSLSAMRSDRFRGTQRLETCRHCRQAYACEMANSRKLPKEVKKMNNKYSNYMGNARARKLDFNISREVFESIILGSCVYCNTSIDIGVDRKDNSRGYLMDNVVPCCKNCNMMKGTKSIEEFIAHCERVIKFQEGSTTISKESTPE